MNERKNKGAGGMSEKMPSRVYAHGENFVMGGIGRITRGAASIVEGSIGDQMGLSVAFKWAHSWLFEPRSLTIFRPYSQLNAPPVESYRMAPGMPRPVAVSRGPTRAPMRLYVPVHQRHTSLARVPRSTVSGGTIANRAKR